MSKATNKAKDEQPEVQEPEVAPEVEPEATEPETPEATEPDALEVLADAGDVAAKQALGQDLGVLTNEVFSTEDVDGEAFEGFKLGAPAPKALYLDKDGETVLHEPRFTDGVGSVLVKEGELVQPSVLRALKLDEA